MQRRKNRPVVRMHLSKRPCWAFLCIAGASAVAVAVVHASQMQSSCVCSAITGTLQAGCLVLQAFGFCMLRARLCA